VKTDTFRTLKKTGSLADVTMAVGLGVLLEILTGANPLIRDAGPYFEVILDEPVDLDRLPYERLCARPGYRYVKKGADGLAPSHGEVIDYDAERAKLLAAREARKSRRAGAKVDDGSEAGAAGSAVRPDWYLYQELNVLQAFGSHNALHAAVRSADPSALGSSVRRKLEAAASGADLAEVETEFSFTVSPVQGFNPLVGKGVNRPKPDGAPVASLSKRYADWFEEWLRYAGTPVVAHAAPVEDDIKFLVLVPAEMRLGNLRDALRPAFLAAAGRVWTSSLLDVCCSLEVARRLIEGSGLLEGDAEWELEGATPQDLVAGIQTAYFKSLGTGRAVSNLSFIAVPGWFPVSDAQAARDWMAIIEEHLGVVSRLREDRSEQYELISAYRDFLSGGDVSAFLSFAAAYGCFVLKEREARRRAGQPIAFVRRLTTVNVGKVVESMQKRYAPILDAEGFRNIARAVRLATVTEQFHKSRGNQLYEIHYGLLHELRRSAPFADRLTKVVSDFVASYNAENARMAERAADGRELPRRRPQVTTRDLEQFTQLVDEYGSEPVGYLLIAYASAREPREEAAGDEAESA